MLDLLYFGTSVSVTQDQTQIPPDWGQGKEITVTQSYIVQTVFTFGYYQTSPTITKDISQIQQFLLIKSALLTYFHTLDDICLSNQRCWLSVAAFCSWCASGLQDILKQLHAELHSIGFGVFSILVYSDSSHRFSFLHEMFLRTEL